MSLVRIMEEDWDYLIILDAMRYDLFKKHNTIKGKLEKRLSLGTCTEEWSTRNFTSIYNNVVYITANPLTSKYFLVEHTGHQPFYEVDEVWDYGWNEDLKGVYPKEVTSAVIRDLEKYPDKKLLIHYLQPHYPFIENPETWIGRGLYKEYLQSKQQEYDLKDLGGIVYHYLKTYLTPVQIRESYLRNLLLILREVKDNLIPKLSGKIIISSDHGEMLGFKEEGWGHGKNMSYIESLKTIPWLIVGET